MRGYAIRRIGRPRPCSPIFRQDHSRPSAVWQATAHEPCCVSGRSASSRSQSPRSPRSSTTTNSRSSKRAVLALGGAASLAAALAALREDDPAAGDVLNKSTFSAFTITSKEQVSPTAFILTVRPSGDSNATVSSSARIREAWRHGLWSVEIKQPQLQIARHYTPLPPLVPPPPPPPTASPDEAAAGGGGGEDDLRFLIRRMDGGEMSNYLCKRGVGDRVWLRGPHLGFDVARRLGAARDVVFLAGGTGVAPALQVARRLLDDDHHHHHRGNDDGDDGNALGSGARKEPEEEPAPSVSILWANRRGADALGRQQTRTTNPAAKSYWPGFWSGGPSAATTTPTTLADNEELPSSSSSLARQIQDLERRHPGRFRISYFVDEEGTFVGARDLEAATTASSSPRPNPGVPASASASCPWHSPAAVEALPDDGDDNDAARSASVNCTCDGPRARAGAGVGAGANLLCVSGPEGFVAAYAGAKRWHGGKETQGAVRGLLGRMTGAGDDEDKNNRNKNSNYKSRLYDGWLVLKL